ncbi:MAG TPA: hypothetical protein VKT77_13215 [Chthonomonadaceae bacterium]|nr:hypothetical protein [Chthonomonadaceae bacterium]
MKPGPNGHSVAALGALLLVAAATAASAQRGETPTPLPPTTTEERLFNLTGLAEPPPLGWHTDFIGPFRGVLDGSFGVKFWPDRFDIGRLQLGGAMDLAPGLRVRASVRRREGEIKAFQVDPDEYYVEAFNQYRSASWSAGASLRAGHIRYLHFPFPDSISEFDQVPGYKDLFGGIPTDYRDAVLVAEAAANSGWGVHVSGRAQAVNAPAAAVFMEAYAFFRRDIGSGWRVESRLGAIAVRQEPLGRAGQFGGDVYVGKQLGEFNVGVLYENKRTEPEYTGVMVQFRPGVVTRALGKVAFDYSRSPEGFTAQIPLLHLRLNESRIVRPKDRLVGEVRAVRIRTLWQQGYLRNEYEHRLESWGETSDPRLHCVATEEPWYLEAEALVSPHLVPDDKWLHDRQGPGQFAQRVTYRFYRETQ